MQIQKKPWGSADNRSIYLFELDTQNGFRACVSNFGAVLQSLVMQKRDGESLDLVLGYDTLAEYQFDTTFFGACIGPIADRMAEGSCILNGMRVQLSLNAGPDSMHSGATGFHNQIWDWAELPDGVAFVRDFTQDQIGFPGTLHARIAYRISEARTLRIEYSASCDCETALSMTNHSYFNLDGGHKHCREHTLTLFADTYAETTREAEPIFTGRALPVEGTPFDMRGGRKIGDVIAHREFHEILTGNGIDHYFLTNGGGMRTHAILRSPDSGVSLECRSDAPGILVYSGNGLENERGKGGAVYGRNYAVCLETGRFPNAVNFEDRRADVLLQPGDRYQSATEFIFSEVG